MIIQFFIKADDNIQKINIHNNNNDIIVDAKDMKCVFL